MNSGFYTIAVALNFERIFMGKYTKIRLNFDALLACCKAPDDAGQALYDDPVIQDRLVRLHIDIERLRLLCTKTAWMIDRGKVPNAEASAQKIFVFAGPHQRSRGPLQQCACSTGTMAWRRPGGAIPPG